jgi:VanZ family protein
VTPALYAARLWETLGWIMLFTVVVLSLVRIEQPLALENADKYQHVLAYASLMYWWGMVQPGRKLNWAVALPLLGLALEWAQTFTAYRVLEWNDAVANALGVALALLLLTTPARRLLAMIDRKLGDCLHAGRS